MEKGQDFALSKEKRYPGRVKRDLFHCFLHFMTVIIHSDGAN